jgi:hypothetical protein
VGPTWLGGFFGPLTPMTKFQPNPPPEIPKFFRRIFLFKISVFDPNPSFQPNYFFFFDKNLRPNNGCQNVTKQIFLAKEIFYQKRFQETDWFQVKTIIDSLSTFVQ